MTCRQGSAFGHGGAGYFLLSHGVEREVEFLEDVHAGVRRGGANCAGPAVALAISVFTASTLSPRSLATRGACSSAFFHADVGGRGQLPEAVTASPGIGLLDPDGERLGVVVEGGDQPLAWSYAPLSVLNAAGIQRASSSWSSW